MTTNGTNGTTANGTMANGFTNPSIEELGNQLKTLTDSVNALLNDTNHPQPSFDTASKPCPTSPEYVALRGSINDAANDLLRLVNGPEYYLRIRCFQQYDLAALQTALVFDIFQEIPESGSVSIQTLSERTKIDVDRLGRLVRLLAADRMFYEVKPDHFAHTALSIFVKVNPGLKAACQFQMDEYLQASSGLAKTLNKFPKTSDDVHSPFAVAHGLPLYQFYRENPTYGARFMKAMAGINRQDLQMSDLKQWIPWTNFTGGKVVDIGGGSGHVSIALAREFRDLEFVVQDGSEEMLTQGRSQDLDDIRGRVSFMQHDFFTPQPVHGAKAYFTRQCTHNWNDADCVRMFQAMVPALEASEPKTPYFINDAILPVPGTMAMSDEQSLRQLDVMMMVALGAKQRTEKEFHDLLKSADPRFVVNKTHKNGRLGVLEVYLERE